MLSLSGHATADHPLAAGPADTAYEYSVPRSWRRRCSSEPVRLNRNTPRSAHAITSETQPSDSKGQPVVHRIKAGDTLEGIAVLYGVSVEEIKRINKIWNAGELFLRSQIVIPEGTRSPVPTREGKSNVPSPTATSTPNIASSITHILQSIDADIQFIRTRLPSTASTPSSPAQRRLYPPPAPAFAHSRYPLRPNSSPKSTPTGDRRVIRVRPNGMAVVSGSELTPAAKGEKSKLTFEKSNAPSNSEKKAEEEMQQWVDMVTISGGD